MWPDARILFSEWKQDVPLKSGWRGIVFAALAVVTLSMVVLTSVLGLRFSENVHMVEPGMAYRSAQLLPEELEFVISEHGIRSIVSLTPPEPDEDWYRAEIALSSAHRIAHYDVPIPRGVRLTAKQLQDLVSALREAPKPVLIHSRSGADRAGLAAAIFQYAIASRPAGEASRQLSIRYGHLPYILPETRAMDASFDEYVAATQPSKS
jgi:protein tyrosine/serine phosphatase